MIYLILSILLSSSLFLCFKWFGNIKVSLVPAICGNYLSCIVTGIAFDGPPQSSGFSWNFLGACALMGVLFFSVFYAMGYASSTIGVGISSAAAKLSLIIPVLYGAFALNETLSTGKLVSMALVIPAIYLMSRKTGEHMQLKYLWLPVLIFTGSGIIDTGLNVLQQTMAGKGGTSGIIVTVFTSALVCALLFSAINRIPLLSDKRSLGFGILLGIPNYFSVYFLIRALGSGTFSSGQFYLLNNTGVMLVSFIAAALLFSEKINLSKAGGIALAGLSMYLVLLS